MFERVKKAWRHKSTRFPLERYRPCAKDRKAALLEKRLFAGQGETVEYAYRFAKICLALILPPAALLSSLLPTALMPLFPLLGAGSWFLMRFRLFPGEKHKRLCLVPCLVLFAGCFVGLCIVAPFINYISSATWRPTDV
jgi:hypothetical protein